ncbi:MAG: sugar ABC transporter ATP-binding protein [Actinomycetota bacterium]|nr:sugar ABC transporter ATP-binding protein [Actinomycetota bacterium]
MSANPDQLIAEVRAVTKRFGSVQALRGVDVSVARQTVHALVGENGAGKSTLGRVFSGILQPDTGSLYIDGSPVRFRRPRDAQRAGIVAVSQELTLVPQLSVIDNVFLGVEERRAGLVERRKARERFQKLTEQFGFDLPAQRPVGHLSVADRQKAEILRALARTARLVVLDEPTSALVANEVAQLLDIVRRIVAKGMTVIFVSHALQDVLDVADTVTVMRDGLVVWNGPASSQTPDSLAAAMLGRAHDLSFPTRHEPARGDPVLAIRGLGLRRRFEDVSFELRPGEIVGIAGLVDSGASMVAGAVAGVVRPTRGQILVGDRRVRLSSPTDALRHGISLLPESRREGGLFMRRPIRENVTIGNAAAVSRWGVVRRHAEAALVQSRLRRFDVRMSSIDARVDTLSGGNQQKVLLAKCVFVNPKVLVAMQPTRGVDVGAKSSIYGLLSDLAKSGMAILMVSPEIEEVYGLAHRILVMHRRRIVAEVDPKETTYDEVMRLVLTAGRTGTKGAA